MTALYKSSATWLSMCLMTSTMLMSAVLLGFATDSSVCVEWELISLMGNSCSLPVFIDLHSLLFLMAVQMISSAVYLFSLSYMSAETHFVRFHLLVLSFVASMVLLVVCPSLLALMIGWDGLGVTSYLLVIYFQSAKSYGAGMITALTNRVGDVLILLSLAFFGSCGTWLFWLSYPSWPVYALLIGAAMTKSAQIPFSSWLPAAMAAPTPVSSLVHSSTLVTAGVYLLFRAAFCSPSAFLLWVGMLTMVMAGMGAIVEMDMKKIVALSTLSQLGLMFTSLGLGALSVAFFHLLAHAFFKAMMFLSVGNLIHLSQDYQDLRKITSCESALPLTLSVGLIANMSLSGLPFMSGFYSKDLMLELMISGAYSGFTLAFYYLSVALTVMYATRFMYMICLSQVKAGQLLVAEDKDLCMAGSMLMLLPLAVFAGSGASYFIFSSPFLIILPDELKNLTLILILTGGSLAFTLFWGRLAKSYFWSWGAMWSLPFLSSSLPLKHIMPWMAGLQYKELTWGPSLSAAPVATSMPVSFYDASYQEVAYKLSLIVLALIYSMYLRMANLITVFEVKSQCETLTRKYASPISGAPANK